MSTQQQEIVTDGRSIPSRAGIVVALFLVLQSFAYGGQIEQHSAGSGGGCGGIGDVHVFVFWDVLGKKNTRNGIDVLSQQSNLRILEVHSKRWPSSVSSYAACHRNFYANNHAEKGFKVPPQFMEDSFVERVKGTGPFTVVLVAVDCEAAMENVTVAPCDMKATEPCDNAPKADMLTFLKRRLRKKLSKANKYAVHATVNGNEAIHDVTSLFGEQRYAELVQKKRLGATWDGQILQDGAETCVKAMQPHQDA